MFLASLILIVSSALFLFYIQTACQSILRRQFQQDYFQSIVNANRLEFPSVRKALDEYDGPVDYARFRMTLKCDYLALTYLLKNAANVNQRFSWEERILMLYFQAIYVALVTRHAIRLKEKNALVNLTAILQYFANVVGQRVNTVRFGNLAPSDYLLNL
jgi:hypothetical protein